MKKRIISVLLAAAMLSPFGIASTAGNTGSNTPELSPRASIEITNGKVRGITAPISAARLKDQFAGDAVILSCSGEVIDGDVTVSSDSVVSIGGETVATFTLPGDTTKDGKINLSDASAMLKYIAKWAVDVSADASDLNTDGKINLSDVSVILKYLAKWDVSIFDDPITFPVFVGGITEYKLLANDPDTDEKIVSSVKMLTGIELEVITEADEDDKIITVGKNLHEKYDFIDGKAVADSPDTAYVDTYDGNIYLTAGTDEGLLGCINYISYKAFTTELDMGFIKGSTGHIEDTDITYTSVITDGKADYYLIRPNESSNTLADAAELIATRIMNDFYPLYGCLTDREDEECPLGEYESSDYEILVGTTDRAESRAVYMTLSPGEYTIRTVSDKIVILGYNDDLTYLAAKDFADNFIVSDDGKNAKLPDDLCITKKPYANTASITVTTEFEEVPHEGEKLELECEQWVAAEMEFTSDFEYTDPVYTMEMDAVFRNKDTGTVYTVPAFWDGGKNFKVRFALTEVGTWEFYTVCSDTSNTGLHYRWGTVVCSEYSGELDVYKHGFVKTVPGTNYFVYADGTPFFYLADTHWTLPLEEIDGYGSVEDQLSAGITAETAKEYGITSQFKYIMDYRAEQGYTVIQSQPLGWWTNKGQNSWFANEGGNIYTYGVNDFILEKFQEYDKRFAYIAKLGFVHANSQFSDVSSMMTEYFAGNITPEKLDKLCRYWVARYSAYPVLWSTAQEGDNDYYGEDRGDCAATPDNNPWHYVIDYVHKYDPYSHPSTCHQERWDYTSAVNSSFAHKESHTWYAAQYYMNLLYEDSADWQRMRDYYGNRGSKPVVNYEGRYDHFWTGTYGARAQGWQAFLNGHVGYGYGVQPIWSIFWSGVDGLEDYSDEMGSFHKDDNWVEGLYAEAGEQVTYIKELLEKYEWWNLVPCFNGSYFYEPNGTGYSVCSIKNDLYLGYFYGSGERYTGLGTLRSMKEGDYEVTWLNCRTGEYTVPFTVNITDGKYKLPQKPGDGDWTIIVEYTGN